MPDTHWPQTINLLADLVVYESSNIQTFLKKLILIVMRLVPVDSCLIYVRDRQGEKFTLIGSKKKHSKLIGKIQIQSGEGITGWVAHHSSSVIICKKAYADKRFKRFAELPEDSYEAFLSIPITDKDGVIGVINLQNKLPYSFAKKQVSQVQAIVHLISSAFSKATLDYRISHLQNELNERKVIEKAKGVLMKKRGLSEKEAYDLLRTEAMKKRKTKREIADAVLLLWG